MCAGTLVHSLKQSKNRCNTLGRETRSRRIVLPCRHKQVTRISEKSLVAYSIDVTYLPPMQNNNALVGHATDHGEGAQGR